jgi:hypothetical protein
MKNILLAFTLLIAASTVSVADTSENFADSTKIEGRWDLVIMFDGKESPSWLEVTHSGHKTLVGHFVGISGSSRPISEVLIDGNKFSFAIPPQWESGDGDLAVEGTWSAKQVAGTVVFPDGKSYSFTGTRAPSLRERKEGTWGKPVKLIQQNDLKGWTALGTNQWVVENGILKSPKSGSNLVTTEKFNDFKLHIEFKYPKGSNSGVYLRGRHEVQVSDSKGNDPVSGELGGVYGFIAPSDQVAKAPGEWQTYDITFIGRMITVVANGKTIINNQEIPGITGGALDSKEGEAGPLMLQGDHGPVEYRNIIITPMK